LAALTLFNNYLAKPTTETPPAKTTAEEQELFRQIIRNSNPVEMPSPPHNPYGGYYHMRSPHIDPSLEESLLRNNNHR
jgi:hypothetical protein